MFKGLLSRPRKIAPPSPAATPLCEALEPRLLLASGTGDVVATFIGGNLYITGDSQGNYINVKNAGLGDNRITVDGSGTTVNGASADWTTPTPVTGNIIIRMNGGNDTLLLQNFTAPRTLTADMGEGENTLTATNQEWSGAATLKSGGGADTFTLNGVVASSNVSIQGGGGGNTISLDTNEFMKSLSVTNGSGGSTDNFSAVDTVIHGNLTVNNGDGGSSFNFRVDTGTASVGGNVTIVSGEGGDYASLNDATLGGRLSCDFGLGSGDHGLSLQNGTHVAGPVSVRSLDGYGYLTIDDSEVDGAVQVNSRASQEYLSLSGDSMIYSNIAMTTGTGQNSLQVSGATVEGNVSVTSAVMGSVNIDGSGGATWLKGNVSFASRTGNDQFRVSGAKISGNIRVDSGTGGSQFNAAAGALLLGNVTLSSFGGNAVVNFNDVSVHGATGINLSSGVDTVTINDCTFSGLVTVNTGSGYDRVEIEEGGETDGPTTIFFGGLRINTGSGDDWVGLGEYSPVGQAVDFRAPSRIDGGPDTDSLYALHLAPGSLTPAVVSFELTP
jgi:hypothetical protein